MVPPKNGFLSLRLPIFGASYLQFFYTRGMAPMKDFHRGKTMLERDTTDPPFSFLDTFAPPPFPGGGGGIIIIVIV